MSSFGYPHSSLYDSTYDTFGSLRLTEGETPQTFIEPLDLDAVKTHLGLDPDDDSEDDVLSMWISAPRNQAEILQGRDLVRKQYDLSYDYWPAYRIELKSPTVSVNLVQFKDLIGSTTKMVENTDYVVDLRKEPAIITPPWNISWPSFTPCHRPQSSSASPAAMTTLHPSGRGRAHDSRRACCSSSPRGMRIVFRLRLASPPQTSPSKAHSSAVLPYGNKWRAREGTPRHHPSVRGPHRRN